MNKQDTDLVNLYNQLHELQQEVINLFAVKFSGLSKYDILRYLQDKIGHKTTQKEYQNVLIFLEKKEMISLAANSYDIPFTLKIELFSKLIKIPEYIDLLRKIQKEYNPYGYVPIT